MPEADGTADWFEMANKKNIRDLTNFYGENSGPEIERIYRCHQGRIKDEWPDLYIPCIALRAADDDLRSRGFKRSTPLEQTEAISAAA